MYSLLSLTDALGFSVVDAGESLDEQSFEAKNFNN